MARMTGGRLAWRGGKILEMGRGKKLGRGKEAWREWRGARWR